MRCSSGNYKTDNIMMLVISANIAIRLITTCMLSDECFLKNIGYLLYISYINGFTNGLSLNGLANGSLLNLGPTHQMDQMYDFGYVNASAEFSYELLTFIWNVTEAINYNRLYFQWFCPQYPVYVVRVETTTGIASNS
jgi:hypothetical protein